MTRFVTLAISVIGGVVLGAQPPQTAPAAFAVASVKPNTSGASRSDPGAFLRGGGFHALNATLRILIHRAYPEFTDRPGRIIAPDWIDGVRYDVEAKTGTDATHAEMIPMLRALLADRFGLRVHTEMRLADGFALVPARTDGRLGPGLRRSQAQCTILEQVPYYTKRADLPTCALQRGFANGLNAVSLRGAKVQSLVFLLQAVAARGVVDRTNLSGSFDIDLEWAEDKDLLASPEPDFRPSLGTAVQDQLGLKLVSERAPVEVLVIDAVRRPDAD
jgi:uncharacterized protein (TIGR03435 family)